MANWNDFLEVEITNKPKQVFLVTGEVSSMVWDKVSSTLQKYESYFRVSEPAHIGNSLSVGVEVAYLVVDPSPNMLSVIESTIRSGASDSFFIIFNGEVPPSMKEQILYIKNKSQLCKLYFNLTAPKTDNARDKMYSFFVMRWSVTRDTARQVCSILEHSPGALYQFDKQFLLVTGGQVLASTKTKKLVEELLGNDTPSLVVSNIVNGKHIDTNFDAEFTLKVLNFLHTTVNNSRLIQVAWDNGNSTVPAVSKYSGLPNIAVLRAWGFAEKYRGESLRQCEDLIALGLENYHNPELLSTLSRIWR